ncbi:cellulose synthase subunit BcsC-related outer membrane protein, partial [Zavarzinia sp.]|uniref:cellulose synthase subunit BcsC-related outer membrane protein n=1 Tax=Zavarzinia sp. TaxID=2027920 RepID=UPI003BB6CFDC
SAGPQIATTTGTPAPTQAPAPAYPALAVNTPSTASNPIGLPAAALNDPMSRDIARELADLRQNTIPFVRGDVGIRSRDGESGLSELTELGATLSVAVSPFDEGRLTVTARPVSLDSGTPEGDGARRFGLNALVPTTVTESNYQALATIVDNNAGVWNLLTPTEKQILGAAITTPDATTLTDFVTSNPTVVAALTDDLRTAITTAVAADAATTLSSFVSDNPTIWNDLTTAQESVLSAALAADSYSFDTARMAALRRAPPQDDAGVALALAYEIGDIKADAGTTPLGFEVQNVVGGVTYAPRLSETTTLKLTGERRAVTDSLLSYAGTVEPFTGKRWGGVTRTGGRVMVSDDDGDVGIYGGGAYYRLEGDNVDSNQQLEATVGAYIRPYKTERAELSVGVNLSYLNYEKNLGEFSFGHGGYFSPQSFYSVSFPVEYTGESRSGKWNYTIGGAIGYQRYEKDAAPYFPTDGKLQGILEDEVSAGLISSAYYAAGSESGVGGNIHGGFDYAFDRQTTVGASASFDSFGDYSESSVMVYVKRLLEVAP